MVFVFRYRIPREKSAFTIGYRNAAGVQRVVVGHNGLVFIGAGTAEVVRLASIQTRNELTFEKYRKFEARSEITFGDKPSDGK